MLRSLIYAAVFSVSLIALANPGLTGTPNSEAKVAGAKLINSVIERTKPGSALLPKTWTAEMQAREIDVNELTGSNFASGRAYGAVAAKLLNQSFENLRARFSKPDELLKLMKKVKTLSITDVKPSKPNGYQVRTTINVPIPAALQGPAAFFGIPAEFHTVDDIRLHKFSDVRGILEWKQANDDGELSYNHGVAIIELAGPKTTKITVVGIHILKPERPIPLIGRPFATNFAKDHYESFIEALESIENSAPKDRH